VGREQDAFLSHEKGPAVGQTLPLRQQTAILLQPAIEMGNRGGSALSAPTALPAATDLSAATGSSLSARGRLDGRQDAPATLVSFVPVELHRGQIAAGGEIESDFGPQ